MDTHPQQDKVGAQEADVNVESGVIKKRSGPAGSSDELSGGIIGRLTALRPDASKSSQKIIDYVLDHAQQVIHMSITELSDILNLSDTSIVRLCQQAGARGFQDLKLALARDLVEPTQFIHEDIAAGDTTSSIMEKVFRSNIQALNDTMKILDVSALEQAVAVILSASRLELYGTGITRLC